MKKIWIIACAFLLAPFLNGQDHNSKNAKQKFDSVPTEATPQLEALGTRGQGRGKELTTLNGDYVDEAGRSTPAQVIHQIPNLIVLRGFASGNTELKFDGKRNTNRHAANEEAMLETFVADTAEGMLATLQDGAAVRLLGRGFKPSTTVAPNYRGPSYDIYEVTAPLEVGDEDVVRKKLYYFDTESGLLLSTRYSDLSSTPAKRIEVRFSDWFKADGSFYPGRIERYENDRRVLSFTAKGASSGPRADVANFR